MLASLSTLTNHNKIDSLPRGPPDPWTLLPHYFTGTKYTSNGKGNITITNTDTFCYLNDLNHLMNSNDAYTIWFRGREVPMINRYSIFGFGMEDNNSWMITELTNSGLDGSQCNFSFKLNHNVVYTGLQNFNPRMDINLDYDIFLIFDNGLFSLYYFQSGIVRRISVENIPFNKSDISRYNEWGVLQNNAIPKTSVATAHRGRISRMHYINQHLTQQEMADFSLSG